MIRRADLRPTRSEVVDTGFAFGLTVLALWTFESSFGGTEFLIVGALAAAMGIAVTHVVDRLGWSVIVTVLVWTAVFVVFGGVLALRSQAILGFLPSIDTMTAAVQAPVEGWKQLLTTVPPVGQTGNLLVLPVFSGFYAASVAVLIARRRSWRFVPSFPPVVVLALGILCGTETPVSIGLHGTVLAIGVLAWGALRHDRLRPEIDGRRFAARRLAGAGGFLMAAALGGIVVADVLPLTDVRDRVVWREAFDPPFDPSVHASPLGYYREYVTELEETPLFEVSGLPEGVPIRMATLDQYDRIVWTVGGNDQSVRGSSQSFKRVGTDVAPDYRGEEVDIEVAIAERSGYDEVWVPTIGEVRSIEFGGGRSRDLAEAFRYNANTDNGALLVDLEEGDSYAMTVSLPIPIGDVPADAAFADNPFGPLELPGQIAGLGAGHVEDIEGVDRVRILRDYLRDIGFYSSSDTEAGQQAVPPGHGEGRLVKFADSDVLLGNAEQYAATLGLILRNSGVAARVVMGFVPKEYQPDGTVLITGGDAEAWVEFLVDDIGWVAAFPTPDRNQTDVVTDNTPKPIPDRETQVPPPPPIVEPDAETDPASDTEQTEREPEEEDEEEEDAVAAGTPWLLVAALTAVAIPVVIIGLIIAVIILVKNRRRRRRARTGTSDQRIANGWRELVDYAVDSGREVPTTMTRREAAELVGAASAGSLAHQADAAVFAAQEADAEVVHGYWADVGDARRSIRDQLTARQRVSASLSLESFRRTKKERLARARSSRRAHRRRGDRR